MQVPPRYSSPGYPQTCNWQEGLRLQLYDHFGVQEGFWETPFTKTRHKLSPNNPLHGCPNYEDLSQTTPICGSKRTFITFTDSEGQGFGQSPERPKAYLCSTRSGTSAGRLEGWGLESPFRGVVLGLCSLPRGLCTWASLGFVSSWQLGLRASVPQARTRRRPQCTLQSSFKSHTVTVPRSHIKTVIREKILPRHTEWP